MEIVNFAPQYIAIGARGRCPHCTVASYFRPVGIAHTEQVPDQSRQRIVNAAMCEACKGFVLVEGSKPFANQPATLIAFFPLGKPNETVDSTIPAPVAEDFKEALRCEWVRAFRACVVMCRRAVEGSAIEVGAKGGRLIEQIDDLFAAGKITEALKDFAHEVRLTGNDGATRIKTA